MNSVDEQPRVADGAAGETVESLLAQVTNMRRFIRWSLLVFVVACVALVFWARRVPDEVRARGFVLVDEHGERAAELITTEGGKTVRLALYWDGIRRVELSADGTQSYFRLAHRAADGLSGPDSPTKMNHVEFTVTENSVHSQLLRADQSLIDTVVDGEQTSTVWQHRSSDLSIPGLLPETSVTIRATGDTSVISTYPKTVLPVRLPD